MTDGMTLFDSHAHLGVPFRGTCDPAVPLLRRAAAAGVRYVLAVGGDPDANERVCRCVRENPGRVWGAVGLDRDRSADEFDPAVLQAQLGQPGIVAVGETGLDFHYGADRAEIQKTLFGHMLRAARDAARPVIVHSREADADTLRFMEDHVAQGTGRQGPPGVLHCFTGGPAFARAVTALGFMVSFSGIVTFRNAPIVREAAREVPDEFLLVETDTPYLAPEPYRGRANEPAFLVKTVRVLADLRGVSPDHVAATTTRNALRLFGIEPAAACEH